MATITVHDLDEGDFVTAWLEVTAELRGDALPVPERAQPRPFDDLDVFEEPSDDENPIIVDAGAERA